MRAKAGNPYRIAPCLPQANWGMRSRAVGKRNETVSIERHVGQRIRARRTMLGLTQQQLADLIGVTYQQAHKYERGINRVSAGRLFELAKALGVEVSFFFEGLAPQEQVDAAPERQRLCLDMARNFARIREERHQEALSQLCRALAEETTLQAGGLGGLAALLPGGGNSDSN